MKEELIQYVMAEADKCYADDFPIKNIEYWIREFFNQYQPDRLNPEDICEAAKRFRDNPEAQKYFNRVLTRNPMPNMNVCDSRICENK